MVVAPTLNSLQIQPIADTTLGLLVLEISVMIAQFCLCLKRKHYDVLPPMKPVVDQRFEKYRNAVPGEQGWEDLDTKGSAGVNI